MVFTSSAQRQPRVDALADSVLTLRTVIVVDYYDYIIDLVLHQNAVIEVVSAISGALNTRYFYSPDNQRSGYQARHSQSQRASWGQWRPNAPPATQNASQKSLGGQT